jgi:hypothetical protein
MRPFGITIVEFIHTLTKFVLIRFSKAAMSVKKLAFVSITLACANFLLFYRQDLYIEFDYTPLYPFFHDQ